MRTVPAGFWRRLLAYTIDTVPITLLMAFLSYLFFGLDERWASYRKYPQDVEVRIHFYELRAGIRNATFVTWLVYSALMEASSWQGTFGKAILGLRVVGPTGERLTLARSIGRNCAKMLSSCLFCLGFVWAAFSKEKRAWHDLLAKTFVVTDRVEAGAGLDLASGHWLRDSGVSGQETAPGQDAPPDQAGKRY